MNAELLCEVFMSVFSKLFGRKSKASYITEIAGLLTDNDAAVVSRLEACASDPKKYGSENAARYMERGIDPASAADDKLCWIGMTDELAENGYLYSADYSSEPEDIIWGLSKLKTYGLIEKYIEKIDSDVISDGDASELAERLRGLTDSVRVCMIDIDSDSCELVILRRETYEKAAAAAAKNGHRIEIF